MGGSSASTCGPVRLRLEVGVDRRLKVRISSGGGLMSCTLSVLYSLSVAMGVGCLLIRLSVAGIARSSIGIPWGGTFSAIWFR